MAGPLAIGTGHYHTEFSLLLQCNLASLWVDGNHSCSGDGTVQVSLLGVHVAAASAAPADHAAERDARLIGRFISELNRTVAVNCSLRCTTNHTFIQTSVVLTVCLSCIKRKSQQFACEDQVWEMQNTVQGNQPMPCGASARQAYGLQSDNNSGCSAMCRPNTIGAVGRQTRLDICV